MITLCCYYYQTHQTNPWVGNQGPVLHWYRFLSGQNCNTDQILLHSVLLSVFESDSYLCWHFQTSYFYHFETTLLVSLHSAGCVSRRLKYSEEWANRSKPKENKTNPVFITAVCNNHHCSQSIPPPQRELASSTITRNNTKGWPQVKVTLDIKWNSSTAPTV